MQGVKGLENAIVDTTGRAIFRTAEGAKPPEDQMNEALKKAGDAFKVRKLQKLKLDRAAAVVEVKLDGFG